MNLLKCDVSREFFVQDTRGSMMLEYEHFDSPELALLIHV